MGTSRPGSSPGFGTIPLYLAISQWVPGAHPQQDAPGMLLDAFLRLKA